MELIIASIVVLSFALAMRSMKDFDAKKDISRLLSQKKTTGTILFFKKGARHYSQRPHKRHK